MAEKIVCQKCGKELGPTTRFCGMCGTPVVRPADAPSSDRASAKPAAPASKPPAPGPIGPSGTQPMPTRSTPPQAPERRERAVSAPPPRSSDRPAAPESRPRSEFQRLLDEVESGFDSIVAPEPAPHEPPRPVASDPTGEIPMDATMARALFDSMVVEHARPLRDFMIEVRLGEPLRAWVDFAMPALRVIQRSAQGMGMGDFVDKLGAFLGALEIAQGGSDRLIRGQLRQAIIDTYSDLIAFMPEAFALEQEANRREAVIVHSLLQQVAGLQKVGIDRIYAAGLTSLALFYVARPTDIAELTHIPLELAQNVVDRFKEYRKKTESLSPEQDRAAELGLLKQQTDQLDEISREYDRLAAGAAGDARRRELRRLRGELMVEIGLLLARLGEVDRLRDLEKLPFSARAARLRAYLDETKKKTPGDMGPRDEAAKGGEGGWRS
jgi:hypothetical protein